MKPPLAAAMAATMRPPVMEAVRWLQGAELPAGLERIDVSQAAPAEPPPEPLRRAIAEAALNDPGAHLYGPDLGLPELREEIAARWSAAYGGEIAPEQVAIASGCNQAFCAAVATLAAPGDEVLLPTPWYFNHAMWLTMSGIVPAPLPTGESLIPDPDRAARMITPKTRAMVLVSPNNPAGAEYPAGIVEAFRDLARERGLALIVDETYRDFDSRSGAPHGLFEDPDWADTLIHLYSFSKAYRLSGHRVGAMIAHQDRLAEVEKFVDCVSICPNQMGQRAALWGLRNLQPWLSDERAGILERRAAMTKGFERLDGWRILGIGAYFAYVEHPFAESSDALARRLAREAGLILLPGTIFMPPDDTAGGRSLRIAFANVDLAGISALFDRLENLPPGLALAERRA